MFDPREVADLGEFCRTNGFDDIILYELHRILDSPGRYADQADAVRTLRTEYGIKGVHAAFSAQNQIGQITAFESSTEANSETSFSGMILEYEWWNESPRDFAGALDRLRSAKLAASGLGRPFRVSAYVGWITQDEAEALGELVDELAVHAYRPGPEDAFEYVKERLSYFDGIYMPIRPIFSAEPDFMGSWLQANGLEQAEHILNTGYDEWTGTAKPFVPKRRFVYFCYSQLRSRLASTSRL